MGGNASLLRTEPTMTIHKDTLWVRQWSDAMGRRAGSVVSKHSAKSPKQSSKRFNSITKKIHFAHLGIIIYLWGVWSLVMKNNLQIVANVPVQFTKCNITERWTRKSLILHLSACHCHVSKNIVLACTWTKKCYSFKNPLLELQYCKL